MKPVSTTEGLYFQSMLIEDTYFAAYVIYAGYRLIRVVMEGEKLTTFEFDIPSEDQKILKEEWLSNELAISNLRAYVVAVKEAHGKRRLAMKKGGEWRDEVYLRGDR